jgi:glucose/arabinose dehydrogenase
MRGLMGLLAVVALLAGLAGAQPVAAAGLPLTLVKDGFTEPVFVTNAGDERLFVVQQDGLVKIVHGDGAVSTFIDLSGVILHDAERGLFSIAFHPNYARNGLFYVFYTGAADGASTIAEYRVSTADPDVADLASGRLIIAVTQPYAFHNGGWLGFHGKYLFATIGDGGSLGDSLGLAQSRDYLNGKILRINPRDPDGGGPRTYSVPASNRFVGHAGMDEIWSLGLRNTWRCSFDRVTGKLWCGDVGQGNYEEIDRVTPRGSGYNFGWNRVEGYYTFTSGQGNGPICTSKCKTLPIATYTHASNGGYSSITGGYVSRRQGAALYGQYVFADYISGRVWEIPADWAAGSPLPDPVVDTDYNISSFGEGADGTLYLVDRNGAIYRLDES